MTVATCVPFRPASPHRAAVWDYIRPRLEQLGWPLHIGDVSDDEGGFSRARSRNTAAAEAIAGGADVLLFHDADMLLPDLDAYQRVVDLAATSPGLVVGFDRFHYLSSKTTQRVLAGDDPFSQPPWRVLWNNGEMWVPVGGITAVTVDAWVTVGGMDERFIGWGCEDTALWYALDTLCGPFTRVQGQTSVHLWHKGDHLDRGPGNGALWNDGYGRARGDRMRMLHLLKKPGGPLDPRRTGRCVP